MDGMLWKMFALGTVYMVAMTIVFSLYVGVKRRLADKHDELIAALQLAMVDQEVIMRCDDQNVAWQQTAEHILNEVVNLENAGDQVYWACSCCGSSVDTTAAEAEDEDPPVYDFPHEDGYACASLDRMLECYSPRRKAMRLEQSKQRETDARIRENLVLAEEQMSLVADEALFDRIV